MDVMEITRHKSGLVTIEASNTPEPLTPPEAIGCEITDQDRRNMAAGAMVQLWEAMGLRDCGGIELPGTPTKVVADMRYNQWRALGLSLLGKDCPECEQYT